MRKVSKRIGGLGERRQSFANMLMVNSSARYEADF